MCSKVCNKIKETIKCYFFMLGDCPCPDLNCLNIYYHLCIDTNVNRNLPKDSHAFILMSSISGRATEFYINTSLKE